MMTLHPAVERSQRGGIEPVAKGPAVSSPWRSYRVPLRVPPPHSSPVLAQIDKEIAWHTRTFDDALRGARHWRSDATARGKAAFHSNCLVTMRYKRIEIARLLRIRREIEARTPLPE